MRARLTRSLLALAVIGVLAMTAAALAEAKTHPNPAERHVFLCYSPKYSDDVVTFRVSQQLTALAQGYVLPVAVKGYKPMSANSARLGAYGLKCDTTSAKPTGAFVGKGGIRLVGRKYDPSKGETGTYVEAAL